MSLSYGLGANLKLGTSQKLTPQMQQAIRILQLSSLELEQEVAMQLERNPFLERAGDSSERADETDLPPTDFTFTNHDNHHINNNNVDKINNSKNEDKPTDSLTDGYVNDVNEYYEDNPDSFDKLSQSGLDDTAIDTDWDNVFSHDSTALASPDISDYDDHEGQTQGSIQDHVRWQLQLNEELNELELLIADYLVDAMDDDGFIHLSVDELYQSFQTVCQFYQLGDTVQKSDIEAVLAAIQECDPIGVGARDLSESLMLQLYEMSCKTPFIQEALIILQHSELLLSNNINELLTRTGLDIGDIEPALALLRTLNPSPGQLYQKSQPKTANIKESYDIPDVLVSLASKSNQNGIQSQLQPEQQVTWQVELNPETLPKLRINQEYRQLVKRGDVSDDNSFLKKNLSDARLFIRSIEERNINLLKVASCIVKRQQAFLLHGATAMQPLILRDIADEVGLHESTVSRLTTSKTMLTPQGLFELKYFFSSSVAGVDGDVSSTAIIAMIEQMIADENPKKPLSDNAITDYLIQQGIDIARRTVAKYREQLGIGSSTQRKQRY